MKYLLLSEKTWHNELYLSLKLRDSEKWSIINNEKDFNLRALKQLEPDKIFIPHWSYLIPREIYENYECILFHMTDLPYGRGGSPLQNLIVRGHDSTKISALRVEAGIDSGKIYLKRSLSLLGTAREIFIRSSKVINTMICDIIDKTPEPTDQKGTVVQFKRRAPKDGNLEFIDDLKKVYDYIRMLDCETYPASFLETENFIFEFTNASFKEVEITANVRITKK